MPNGPTSMFKLKTTFLLAWLLLQLLTAPLDAADASHRDCLLLTNWIGKDGPVGDVTLTTFRFQPDGVLVYSYNGNTHENAHWKQTGDRLYFEMNDKYRQGEAKINGNRIEIKSWNVTGVKWRTTLRPVP